MKAIIFISMFILFSSEKQLKDKPLKKGSIKLSEKLTIIDEEGFYNRSMASMNEDYILVYDAGSKIAFTYNHKGEQLNSFGKEGNGPGEFNFIRDIHSNKDYMIFSSFRKTQLFDKNGKFITELPDMPFNAIVEFKNDKITAKVNNASSRTKYKEIVYSTKGKILLKKENDSYDPNRRGFRNMNSDRIKARLTSPRDLTKYENGYLQYHPGEYKLEILDNNFKSKIILKRAFDRIKELPNNFASRFNNGNKERQKRIAQFREMRKNITGGLQSDIRNIIGSYNGYIFVQTAFKEIDELNIDIISPEFEYLDQVSIKKDQVQSVKIENNHLIVNYKSQEDGPYVKIYSISIN